MWAGLITAAEEAQAEVEAETELMQLTQTEAELDQITLHLRLMQSEAFRVVARLTDPASKSIQTLSSLCEIEQTLFSLIADAQTLRSSPSLN